MREAWDRKRLETITLVSGSAISAWASLKGLSAAQGVGAARPLLLGGHPAFDGLDDELSATGVGGLPVGSASGEIWLLVNQKTLATDTAGRRLFGYGGATNPGSRQINRAVVSGVNRASINVGDGTNTITVTDTHVDFSGRHFVRVLVTPTATSIGVDGGRLTTAAVVPNTGSVRTRLGANTAATASQFANADIDLIVCTDAELTGPDLSKMTAYFAKEL